MRAVHHEIGMYSIYCALRTTDFMSGNVRIPSKKKVTCGFGALMSFEFERHPYNTARKLNTTRKYQLTQ